jgi:RNA polymerase sigma-70 factor (ECF subfamily)
MTAGAPCDQSLTVAPRDEQEAEPTARGATLRDLFTMHAPYVWNSLRRLGVPTSDLEDVTHDVFVQVQRHLAEYDPARPARPWLFGFAFRLASQERRRASRRYETHPARPLEPSDEATPADEQLAAEEDRRLALEALFALDLDKRAILVLTQIDEEPVPEAARALGVPLNTAYSRLRAARADFAAVVKRLRAKRRER